MRSYADSLKTLRKKNEHFLKNQKCSKIKYFSRKKRPAINFEHNTSEYVFQMTPKSLG